MSDTISRRDAFYVLDNCHFASEQEKKYAYSLMEQVASANVKDTNVLSNDMISREMAIDAFWKLDAEIRPSAIDAILNMLKGLPSAQPEGWLEQNKDKILQAGMEGREIDFHIGGRLFAIREKAQ